MVCRIIPLIRLPQRLGIFDYAIPDALRSDVRVGSCVEIPFRKKTIEGIVCALEQDELTKHEKKTLKEVIRLIPDRSLLREDVDLILWMSRTYICSPATVLRMMLGTELKRKRGEQSTVVMHPESKVRIAIPEPAVSNLKDAFEAILADQRVLFRPAYADDRILLYAKMTATTRQKKEQCLIITPTLAEMRYLAVRLAAYIEESAILWHHFSSMRARDAAERACRDGSAPLVIGTRGAAALPFKKLGAVIVDRAESWDLKNFDQHPRYDARDIALYRARTSGIPIVFCSHAPRMEDYAASGNGEFSYRDASTAWESHTVHLGDERRKGFPPLLSEALCAALKRCAEAKKTAVIFLNRKGTSRLVVCKECEHVFSCLACKNLRAFFAKENILVCAACARVEKLPARCPSCRSTDFAFLGTGSQKLAEHVREITELPVVEITKDAPAAPVPQPAVVIATSALMSRYPELCARADCVAIALADPLPSKEDFRSLETQWQTFADILYRAPRSAKRIIQSYDPLQPFVQALAKNDYETMARRILEERTRYGWPPATRLIRVLVKKNDARAIARSLEVACAAGEEIERVREGAIVIKMKSSDPSARLKSALETLPEGCFVDNDPIVL